MNSIVPFSTFTYKETIDHPVRSIMQNDEIWFLAADVCEALDIANVSQAVENLDDDEKNTISITYGIPGNPNRLHVNESGLYHLIFQSRKPEAKTFRRWITHKVLPSIRKTGGYSIHPQVKLLHPTSTRYELSTADTQQLILTYVERLPIPSARDLSRYITCVPVQDLRLWLRDLTEHGLLKEQYTGRTWRYKRAN